MYKKLHKFIFLPCILLCLLFSSLFFVACKNENEVKPNVFNDIAEYIKAHPIANSTNQNFAYILTQAPNNNNPNLYDKQFFIMYNTTSNRLYFTGQYNQVEFICQLNSLEDYSKNIITIFMSFNNVQPNTTNQVYFANVDLPATIYTNIQSTSPLPEFYKFTENIPADIMKSFRNQASLLLNEYFNELNNFYVQKVKNGDTRYNGAIYQYFYLPIIQIENN